MFTGFQVNLYVDDVARSLVFYTAIGGVETFRNNDADVPDHVELRLAGPTVGLASVRAAREHHGLDVSAEGTGAELGLWTDDLDTAWTDLLTAGATVMAEPVDTPNGLRVAWAADPDGNPVHLVMRREK